MRRKFCSPIFHGIVLVFAAVSAASAGNTVKISGNGFSLVTPSGSQPMRLYGIRVGAAAQPPSITNAKDMTNELLANLSVYKKYGVNAITVFYQGCSGGFSNPFHSQGTLIDANVESRMESIIQACDASKVVMVVGIFYGKAASLFDAPKNLQEIRNVVSSVAEKLKPYRNVIINIANEQNCCYAGTPEAILQDPQTIIDLCRLVHSIDPARLVGGGGFDASNNATIGSSSDVNVLLYDSDTVNPAPHTYYDQLPSNVKKKPVINVELYGSATKISAPQGVFPDFQHPNKQDHFNEVNATLIRPGLSIFFHDTPWVQGVEYGWKDNYFLGGLGNPNDPGIRWYFQFVQSVM